MKGLEVRELNYTQVPSLRKPLAEQMDRLKKALEGHGDPRIAGILLIGSCARDQATYRSDIDLLVILNQDSIKASDAHSASELLEPIAEAIREPLPVQLVFVGRDVFHTTEPAMRENLRSGLLLYDASDICEQLEKAKGSPK